ncbi:hypothetical protein BT93_L4147 [Corymbia citriodora subsp. variegata]|uniref:Uncharacterized protein n=1 Tax=Corymbia citriodora subsp. variegata TaxID=360336 RepID=A0A8T0CHB3_CORYI|nr:hypothetical protein BT93_L4147 [Corymbia citriodora subsp. variegata]
MIEDRAFKTNRSSKIRLDEMIGQAVSRQPTAGRDQKKCKFEAAFKSMQQQAGPSGAGPVVVGGGGGGSGGGRGAEEKKSEREARAADVEEERRKRERVEFLLQLVCWGPD